MKFSSKQHINLEKKYEKWFARYKKISTFATSGEMAEWSIAAVLKTVVPRGTWGSTPYFSADKYKKD
jgi:hypothetical protein